MKSSQKGFALLESLLILVLIAVISGVGWYAWHTKKNKNTVGSSQTYTAKKSESTSSTQADNFLIIKEWGIKIPLSSSTKDAYYTSSGDNRVVESFTIRVHSLDNEQQCNGNVLWPATVSRLKLVDIQALEKLHEISSIPDGSDVEDYHYYIGVDGQDDACITQPSSLTALNKVKDAFKNSSTGIEAE